MDEPTTRLAFRTLHGPWSANGEGPYVDDVEIDDPTPELVRLASHAHAAGVLEVTDGLDLAGVQSQEDGEAALLEAMGDPKLDLRPDGTRRSYWTGPWHEGNLRDHIATWAQRVDGLRDGLPILEEGADPDEETVRALKEIAVKDRQIAAAQAELATVVAARGGDLE